MAELEERFHALRRALHRATMQLAVARAREPAEAIAAPLEKAEMALEDAAALLAELEDEVRR